SDRGSGQGSVVVARCPAGPPATGNRRRVSRRRPLASRMTSSRLLPDASSPDTGGGRGVRSRGWGRGPWGAALRPRCWPPAPGGKGGEGAPGKGRAAGGARGRGGGDAWGGGEPGRGADHHAQRPAGTPLCSRRATRDRRGCAPAADGGRHVHGGADRSHLAGL